jgi:hypothetical protein
MRIEKQVLPAVSVTANSAESVGQIASEIALPTAHQLLLRGLVVTPT